MEQVYLYDAYGNALGFDSATAGTSILYAGQQTDATGQQYLRARYYDSRTGRFTNLDEYSGRADSPLSSIKHMHNACTRSRPEEGGSETNRATQLAMVRLTDLAGFRWARLRFR